MILKSIMETNKLKSDIFVKKIITNNGEKNQLNFLRVYPALKLKFSIIELWYKLYNESVSKKIKENKQKKTDKRKNNIINFLKLGLIFGYLNIDIYTYVNIMQLLIKNEEKKLVNIFKLNFMKYQFLRIPQKTHSSPEINSIIEDVSSSIDEEPIIPRETTYLTIDDIDIQDFVGILNKEYIRIYRILNVHDILNKVLFPTKISNTIKEINNLFTILSNLPPTEILLRANTINKRIKIIKKFIQIAQKFIDTYNFAAACAIIAGLNNNAVQRIKCLWKKEKKYTIHFSKLLKFICCNNGYKYYRETVKKTPKHIPFLAIVFSDFEHFLEVNIIDNKGYIKMECYNLLVKMVTDFESSIPDQIYGYSPGNVERNLIDFIKNFKVMNDEFYDFHSYQIQPPNSVISEKLRDKATSLISEKLIDKATSTFSEKIFDKATNISTRIRGKKDIPNNINENDILSDKIIIDQDKFKSEHKHVIIKLPLDNINMSYEKDTITTSLDNKIKKTKVSTSTIKSNKKPERKSSLPDIRKLNYGDIDIIDKNINKSKKTKRTNTISKFPKNDFGFSSQARFDQLQLIMEGVNVKEILLSKYEFIYDIPVKLWTNEQILHWLEFIGLEEYAITFKENQITGFSLLELTDNHLKNELQINALGHRIKILKFINFLKEYS